MLKNLINFNNINWYFFYLQNRINTTSSAVKIAQIVGAAPTTVSSHPKMRAIYNNNTIQHENGVTTIVPASSLAATQAAAMQHANMGPSTVTITPAPHHHHLPLSSSSKKIVPSAATGHSSNTSTNTHLSTINGNVSNLSNQKIILVKTSTKYNTNGGGSATLTPSSNSSSSSNPNGSNSSSMVAITSVCKNLK